MALTDSYYLPGFPRANSERVPAYEPPQLHSDFLITSIIWLLGDACEWYFITFRCQLVRASTSRLHTLRAVLGTDWLGSGYVIFWVSFSLIMFFHDRFWVYQPDARELFKVRLTGFTPCVTEHPPAGCIPGIPNELNWKHVAALCSEP